MAQPSKHATTIQCGDCTPGHYPGETETYIHTKNLYAMFVAASFIIAQMSLNRQVLGPAVAHPLVGAA